MLQSIAKWIGYILLFSNVTLATSIGWNYVDLYRIQQKKQAELKVLFPPLKSDEILRILKGLFNEDNLKYEVSNFGECTQYTVLVDGQRIGYAYQVRKDIHCPVCRDVRYFVGINTDETIKGIFLVNSFERYGNPIEEETVTNFLQRFIGRNLTDLRATARIDGISGATKTTSNFVEGLFEIKRIRLSDP